MKALETGQYAGGVLVACLVAGAWGLPRSVSPSEGDRPEIERLRTLAAQLQDSHQREQAEIASLQKELAALRSSPGSDCDELGQRLADMRRRVDADRRAFNQYVFDHAMARVEFEVGRGQTRELTPGVTVTITSIDTSQHKVNGSLLILPDKKTVWLREQNEMQPVIYYSVSDNRSREIVFTHTTKDSAVGYLLTPADSGFQIATYLASGPVQQSDTKPGRVNQHPKKDDGAQAAADLKKR